MELRVKLFNSEKCFIVDDILFSKVSHLKWSLTFHGYVEGYSGEGKLLLHRVIIGASKGQSVDHINGDRLDNRLSNLRICDQSGNAKNVHRHKDNLVGFKGVHIGGRGYRAQIMANGKKSHLGYFDSALEAARAYDRAALELHGEYARLNFPLE